MNGAIGHRGRLAGVSTTPFLAADVDGTPARVAAMLRGPGTAPHGFAIAVVWLATTGVAIAAAAASTWSLLSCGQNELNAKVSTSTLKDDRDLCIFTTGDPRDGQWALA